MSAVCGCGCGGHDERHAPPAVHNPPGRRSLDYRVGEYGSFLAAMLDRLASPAYPALRGLTVRTPDDPSIGLLESWAVVGDLLTFHSERIAEEAYLRTANEHRSLALLGRLVGHRPRPGIAADTHLAYTLDRDPREAEVSVVIPRGSRSNSVPTTSGEQSQVFETGEDLTARASWNELAVRRRRPSLLTPADLERRSAVRIAGTASALSTGDRLLFVFGGERAGDGGGQAGTPGERRLLSVARVSVDRDDDVTVIGLPQSAPPVLGELVDELREWITEDDRETEDGAPTPGNPNPRPVSRYIEEFDAQVLAPLRADLDDLGTPAAFAARLAGPHERLAEAQAVATTLEERSRIVQTIRAVVGLFITKQKMIGSRHVRRHRRRWSSPPARPRCWRWARCCPRCAHVTCGRVRRAGPPPGAGRPARNWRRSCCRSSSRGWQTGCTRHGGRRPRPSPPCCVRCRRCG
ncbi:baseplate J/gp47 family protein [Streptomyces pristinaespiralis]|uniref:hypothetical protein n=1 Tax=Streptomyces pristinaespiralis TaxID=38300 RepID=UPI00055B3AA8|nr:hypothetical protein [Streptomyces pristinaespiralis]